MAYDSPANSNQTGRVATRIESDIEMVNSMTSRINRHTGNIVHIARALGYFEPPKPEPGATAATPIAPNMQDSLRDLSRAIDGLEGSMNLFN